jgi:hypothetical protein
MNRQLTDKDLRLEEGQEPIRVEKQHWQISCWKLALAQKPFEVVGFGDSHQPFGFHLCTLHGYEMTCGEKKTAFTPRASKTTPAPRL